MDRFGMCQKGVAVDEQTVVPGNPVVESEDEKRKRLKKEERKRLKEERKRIKKEEYARLKKLRDADKNGGVPHTIILKVYLDEPDQKKIREEWNDAALASLKPDQEMPEMPREIKHSQLYYDVVDDISHYRLTCKKLFAQRAIAELAVLEAARKEGKPLSVQMLYEESSKLKDELFKPDKMGSKSSTGAFRKMYLEAWAPDWMSFVWDQAKRQVDTTWDSEDPELLITRGYAYLVGIRDAPKYNYTALPVLCCDTVRSNVKMHEYGISLQWNKKIGFVDFKFKTSKQTSQRGRNSNSRKGRLDPRRLHEWNRLRKCFNSDERDPAKMQDHYIPGLIRLGYAHGEFTVYVTYTLGASVLEKRRAPVRDRAMTVSFMSSGDENKFIRLAVENADVSDEDMSQLDCQRSQDLSVAAIVEHLKTMEVRGSRLKNLIATSANRPVARKRYRSRQEQAAKNRTKFTQGWNHTLVNRIIKFAESWRCGLIRVYGMPKPLQLKKPSGDDNIDFMSAACASLDHGLLGWQWPWTDFVFKLKTKAHEAGIKLAGLVDSEKVQERKAKREERKAKREERKAKRKQDEQGTAQSELAVEVEMVHR